MIITGKEHGKAIAGFLLKGSTLELVGLAGIRVLCDDGVGLLKDIARSVKAKKVWAKATNNILAHSMQRKGFVCVDANEYELTVQ